MNDAYQYTPGTHVVVEGLDGERSDAVVVGYHDQPAGEHEIDTDRGSTTLAEYWRGHGVDADEPVVAIRYAKGVSWQGTIETWSKSTYDFPESQVRRPETDGGRPQRPISPREQIRQRAEDLGVDPDELLIQSKKRDPMYLGTEGQHTKAEWAADLWERAVANRAAGDRRIHPRGVHYFVVEEVEGVGSPTARTSWDEYTNRERCYNYLQEGLRLSRALGYIPLDGVIDEKHSQTVIHEYGEHQIGDESDLLRVPDGVDVPSIPDVDEGARLRFGDDGFAEWTADRVATMVRQNTRLDRQRQQPYHIECWCEKTIPGGDRIRDVLRDLGINVLVEGEGDLSYGLASDLATRVREAEKPAVIFYLSDFDAKGHGMPEKMTAKLAWLEQRGDLEHPVVLHPLALTLPQVEANDYTRSPIPASDATGSGGRAYDTLVDDWEQRMGEGAVEINIFEHRPDEFERLLREEISAVIDSDLRRKNREAVHEWADDVRDEVIELVENAADVDDLQADLKTWVEEFNTRLEDAREGIEALQTLADDDRLSAWQDRAEELVSELDVPDFDPPDGDGDLPGDPLYDSRRDYSANLRRAKQHHKHGESGDRDSALRTDGGHQPDRITCGVCGTAHETVADAIECCEKRGRDGDGDDPVLTTDGGPEPADPDILDCVRAPDDTDCQMWSGVNPDPCDASADYLVVFDGSLNLGERIPRNVLACDSCFHPRDDELRADGGRDRLADAAERQAEALETLADRQRVTNAALAELIRTIDTRAAEQIGIEEPTASRTGRSVAGWIEDAALDLAEGVDLDAVDRAQEDR